MNKLSREVEAVMKAWAQMSREYQSDSHISIEDVHYSPFGPGEKHLGLLGDVSGKKVIELGCVGG